MNLDKERLKAAVHYICRRSNPGELGKTKLHKILWLSDVYAYRHRGTPLTGEMYRRRDFGPCSVHLDEIIEELTIERKLFVQKAEYFDFEKFEFIGKGEPDMSLFNEYELRLIEENRRHVCEDHTAGSISEKTHDEIWKMAIPNEVLPYEVMLVADLAPINDEDIAWAQSIIKG